jgi:hypothetical protein
MDEETQNDIAMLHRSVNVADKDKHLRTNDTDKYERQRGKVKGRQMNDDKTHKERQEDIKLIIQ